MNCNCHRYVVLPENSSIRFERSKGKNLGYPQLCTHSLQNKSYHQTNNPDRICRVNKSEHGIHEYADSIGSKPNRYLSR